MAPTIQPTRDPVLVGTHKVYPFYDKNASMNWAANTAENMPVNLAIAPGAPIERWNSTEAFFQASKFPGDTLGEVAFRKAIQNYSGSARDFPDFVKRTMYAVHSGTDFIQNPDGTYTNVPSNPPRAAMPLPGVQYLTTTTKPNIGPDLDMSCAWTQNWDGAAGAFNGRKEAVMREAVRAKIEAYPEVKAALLNTDPEAIIVESTNRDSYWADAPVPGTLPGGQGQGPNRLGIIWMEERNRLLRENSLPVPPSMENPGAAYDQLKATRARMRPVLLQTLTNSTPPNIPLPTQQLVTQIQTTIPAQPPVQPAAPAEGVAAAAPNTPALKGTKAGVEEAKAALIIARDALIAKMRPDAPTEGKSKEELQKELVEAARIYALEHFLALKNDINYTDADAGKFKEYQKSLEDQVKQPASSEAVKSQAEKILEGMKKGEEESLQKKEVPKGTIRFSVGQTKKGKPCVNIEGEDMEAAKEFLMKKFPGPPDDRKFVVKPGKDGGPEKWKIPSAPPTMAEVMAEMKTALKEKNLNVELPTEKEWQKFSKLPGATTPPPTKAKGAALATAPTIVAPGDTGVPAEGRPRAGSDASTAPPVDTPRRFGL